MEPFRSQWRHFNEVIAPVRITSTRMELTSSVAVCTYNGQDYIESQLRSICEQSQSPDEVVVLDDCSSDDTVSVVERFAEQSSVPIRLSKNNENLGYAANFDKAIRSCCGDIVFLSDQDDVWRTDKVEITLRQFERFPHATFSFSDLEAVDERLQPLGYTAWKCGHFSLGTTSDIVCKSFLPDVLERDFITGASMAIRSSHLKDVSPVPSGWVHDAWYSLLLSFYGPGIAIKDPLVQYRQHAKQQIGLRRTSTPSVRSLLSGDEAHELNESLVREICRGERYLNALDLIEKDCPWGSTPHSLAPTLTDKKNWLASRVNHFRARLLLRSSKSRRISLWLRELLARRYHCYSVGFSSAARDMLRI